MKRVSDLLPRTVIRPSPRIGRRLLVISCVTGAMTIPSACARPTPCTNCSEEAIPIVEYDPSALERLGVGVPAWLHAEAQIGVRDCFLKSTVRDRLAEIDLQLVRCSSDRAVAAGKDRIGLAPDREQTRQPLTLTISRGDSAGNFLKDFSLIESGTSSTVEQRIRETFSVSPARKSFRYHAVHGPDAEFLGRVIISSTDNERCSFSYFEPPELFRYPASVCRVDLESATLTLTTNSLDYEEIRRFIDKLLDMDW